MRSAKVHSYPVVFKGQSVRQYRPGVLTVEFVVETDGVEVRVETNVEWDHRKSIEQMGHTARQKMVAAMTAAVESLKGPPIADMEIKP